MKLWLILGILSYLSYSISTSIDKHMMIHNYGVFRTNTIKMFFDGVILLIIGLLFFQLSFTKHLLVVSIGLGLLYALGGIIYFLVLKYRDVGQAIPYTQATEILLIFLGALLFFNESAVGINYLGIVFILAGVYAVLSKTGLRFPKPDKSFVLLMMIVVINVIYWLLVKKTLNNAEPITLAIVVYFTTTIALLIYQALFRKQSFQQLKQLKTHLPRIITASFFGAMGTFLIFTAVSMGDASKVYPLAGINSVFIFIIATLFLKEKFTWHRLIGTLLVFAGIFLVSI